MSGDFEAPYRIYRDADGKVLIQTANGQIELSATDAVSMANDIRRSPLAPGARVKWTPELSERVRSLYTDEEKSPREIASILGLRARAVRNRLQIMKVPPHDLARSEWLTKVITAHWAKRRETA